MKIEYRVSAARWQKWSVFCFLTLLFLSGPARANEAGFDPWLAHFALEAEAAGVSPATLARVLPQITFDESVIELDRKQPEGRLSFEAYARGILSPQRIEKGLRLKEDYADALRKISARTGVSPGTIIALWGVESSYGVNPGHYSVLDSLATLAYEGRRADFFKRELIHALKIIDEEQIDPEAFEGSWAGAMGQCQFMPSTFRAHAVDFDGDGKRDIWGSDRDALASIAHYLKAEGWKPNWRWGREVRLSRPVPAALIGLEVAHDLVFWAHQGLLLPSGRALPQEKVMASLVQPDGPGGRSFLAYDNFKALMRWNRSTYFATSVGLLADQIDRGQ